ncbi:MAG TPA: hypothetical protein VFD46_07090 [Chryseolinea sp.]|nr:hypothetical protein [Chryseolinea sp.]
MKTAEEFLIKRAYRKYPQLAEWPYEIHNLYEQRLSEIESPAVCETNDRLCIHIKEYKFHEGQVQYSINITAERHSVWWDLSAYSLSADELIEKIEFLENSLIKTFNAL